MIRLPLAALAARWGLLSLPLLALGAGTAQAQQRDHAIVGIGIAAGPAYQGADDYRVLPLPALDISKGWFFAQLRNGVGIAPVNTQHLTLGVGAVFVQGIRGRDLPIGIERVSDAVGVRAFASLRAGGVVATVGASRALGGTDGALVDASLSYPVIVSPRFMLAPTLGATWADRRYNDGYFGVSTAEALASGLSRYTAGAGVKDVSAALTANYRLTSRISLTATASVTTLTDAVNDSPIVKASTRPFGIVALTYRL